jgi:cytochrome c553
VTQLALRRLGPPDSLCVLRSVLGADRVPEALARVILERGDQLMAKKRRKTLIVCADCHAAIHGGRPTATTTQ